MLDLNLIRESPEKIRTALLKRLPDVDFAELLEWDRERRRLIARSDELKARRKRASSEIPLMKKRGEDVSSLVQEMKKISDAIKDLDSSRGELDRKIRAFLEVLPNIPADDVPAGGKENKEILREWGKRPEFDFEPKDHMELATGLGLVDYEGGAKLGGSGFWIYRHRGAVLEWALLNYFVQEHMKDGYEFILPPHILNYQCGYTAGQFPKFSGDVFHISRETETGEDQFLLPTSETALVSIHRDEILFEEQLPRKYFSFTPCYRKEAGSYRTEERGMIRGHQFNKVEMFQYTLPEESEAAHEELLAKAERLVQGLGLHFRTAKLAAGDCGAAMGKTYDVEVWIPSIGDYKEVSSISNAYDYQARRGNMRFKRKETGRNEFLHTLNASGLATSRLLPAICEQLQQSEGSVLIPEVLHRWTGFKKILPEA
jgi:seryl-tRNA synthetase